MSGRFPQTFAVTLLLVLLIPPLGSTVLANTLAQEALAEAASSGDLDGVQALLQQGADIDARLRDGSTALHQAVLGDHTAISLKLLALGADPASADRYGITPLYLAALNGNADIVAALLAAGVDANTPDPSGETALMTAVRTGRREVVELLLAHSARVDQRDPEFAQTALMLAVREDHPDLIELLLSAGAEIDAHTRIGPEPAFVPPCKGTGCGSEGVGINRGGLPDRGRRDAVKGGMSALLYAARDGRLEAAHLLVAAGADIEQAEANGIRPLLMALLNNQLAVAAFLLEQGADPNADDFWGRTPLFAAVDYRNLDMNNREQDSPVDNGVAREPILDIIKRLLEHGATVNARTREVPPSRKWLYSLNDVSWVDFTGQTAFLRAALAGDVSTMRLLLDYGADPRLPTFAGTTPLMAAAGVNWVVAQTYTESPQSLIAAIELCLEHGADVNARNSMGLTALLGAANRGANDIIRLLVAKGAELDIVDAEGRSPLRWAEGVFLAAVGAERKPATIALLQTLMAEASSPQ
ncbi:MAG: ankyrin repeat domain-containing protein [Pseudomonadales bacterium]|nr:ankyrin repeat domain-containing protein [Pseudomonadales bacterium]